MITTSVKTCVDYSLVGACCFPNGTCGDSIFEPDCTAVGGIFQGVGILCSTVTCPPPVGACCLSNDGCLVEMAAEGRLIDSDLIESR